ncbi:TonB-dependent receptor [soil metagenome]
MARINKTFTLTPVAAAAMAASLLAMTTAHAQQTPAPPSPAASTPSTTLTPISVTGLASPAASVAGFGSLPLAEMPIQATIYSASQLKDDGVRRLSDITRLDPSVSDSYNSEGYWDQLAIRGYTLDQRNNYRRDGMPINAQTSIPLDNKSRLEVLKGISGIQAGTSAPGGLVNYVVKRPTDAPVRSVELGFQQRGSLLGAVDISQRFGASDAFGLRVNAAYEKLSPQVRDLDGHRNLLAVAGDWRLAPGTLIEAEFETSERKQPSQPGFSLLGNGLPAPGDPRINLNNLPWSQPNVMNANTGSLRLQQRITADWQFTAHYATQRLRSDDRLAYPFGCSAEGNFDRYCSDGTFDVYDFRSDGERRTTNALDLSVTGKLQLAGAKHELTTGVMRSKLRERYNQYANNYVGSGNIEGTAVLPADPSLVYANTDRDERSTEFYVRDVAQWTERFSTWLGVRHTRIDRSQVATDGTAASSYEQSFTTPWLAATYAIVPGQIVYASWGQGIESQVAPALPQYANSGSALPSLKSRQFEVGFKGGSDRIDWSAAYFDITRPMTSDIGTCDPAVPGSCIREADGSDDHCGVEASLGYEGPAWGLRGGVQALRARREGSSTASLNGLRSVNVPELSLKLQARYNVAQVPNLALLAGMSYDGNRMAITDNSVSIPSLTRFDLGLRYVQRTSSNKLTWRAGVDNLFDKRAWRESPIQFGHVYLYPLAPRTFRASVTVDL